MFDPTQFLSKRQQAEPFDYQAMIEAWLAANTPCPITWGFGVSGNGNHWYALVLGDTSNRERPTTLVFVYLENDDAVKAFVEYVHGKLGDGIDFRKNGS